MNSADANVDETTEQKTLVVSSAMMCALQSDVDLSQKTHKLHLLTCILVHHTLPFEMCTLHKQFVPLCVTGGSFTGQMATIELEKEGFFVQFGFRENPSLGINCELESKWGDHVFLRHPPGEIISTEKSRKEGLVFLKRHFFNDCIQDFRLVDATPVCIGTNVSQHLGDMDIICLLEFHFGSLMCQQLFSNREFGVFEHFFDVTDAPHALNLRHNFASQRDDFIVGTATMFLFGHSEDFLASVIDFDTFTVCASVALCHL